MPEHADRLVLRRLLSNERFESYTVAMGGDLDAAFDLYEWNMAASSAVLSVSAMLEVVLRNALDRQLQDWGRRRRQGDWLDEVPLDGRGKKDIVEARRRAARRPGSPTHGHVVAELNLGFWRYMLSRRYKTSLWVPSLHRAFPGIGGDASRTREIVEAHVEQLHFLRNRAAHHEPIHRRDLVGDVARAEAVMGYIDPNAKRWLQEREAVRAIVAERPTRKS